ncbi:MAG: DUF5615 family PIN-like protein [Bryobacterales bacterium]|nr:DUF5615 family PIN-like protein [Bryobacterales bacterium]
MRFLVDECTGPGVAKWLREQGHDVRSIYEGSRGMVDDEVLRIADAEKRILITNDKDFGEKTVREKYPHCGIVLLRLEDERTSRKIDVIRKLLEWHAGQLSDHFVVVTEKQVRFARTSAGAS